MEPIAGSVFLRFKVILNAPDRPDCFEECQSIEDICYRLDRIEQCRWIGTIDQDAGCFPDSSVEFTLSCDAGTTTMRVAWTQSPGNVAYFQKVVLAPTINCDACDQHILWNVDTPSPPGYVSPCDHQFGWVELNFKPFATCCHLCPDQYEVTLSGFGPGDETGRCDQGECEQLNGTYLVDFDSSNAFPIAGCSNFPGGGWCRYSSAPLNYMCEFVRDDEQYGWCIIHLFIRVRDNCQTEVQVEVESDVDIDLDCDDIIDHVVGAWYKISNDDCRELDETLTEQCGDQSWNCSLDDGTIRVRLPGEDEDRVAVTRLTPAGYPGRRYGA